MQTETELNPIRNTTSGIKREQHQNTKTDLADDNVHCISEEEMEELFT